MAFYRTIQKNKGLAYDEEAFAPSTWDYLTATSEQTWIDSSFSSGARIDELNRANGAQSQIFVGQGMGFQPLAESATEPVRMSVEAQTKRIDEAGLSSHLKAEEGFTPEALDIVIERKKEELIRQTTLSYDMPWYVDAMAFGVEFGTAMLDPINIASAFVPVIGEARALGMLTRAGKQGALALAKQRAKIGLIEGTVGAAMVEPLTYYAHDQEQADYDMYDSLVNVLSGGVFGATLQPSFGAIGDVIRKKRGGRAPWEMLSPTEESEQLRQGFIDQAYTAYIAANPNGKREEIVAAASLFDARARAHAYDVGSGETGVHDYYAKHMPRFEKGNVGEGLADGALEQAMYKAHEDNVSSFASRVLQEPATAKKSFFIVGDVSRENIGFNKVRVELGSDQVRHSTGRHPDATVWDNITDIIEQGEVFKGQVDPVTWNESIIFLHDNQDGTSSIVMGSVNRGKKGTRFVVGTAFKDSTKRAKNWIDQKKDATPYQHDEEITSYPRQKGDPTELGNGISKENVKPDASNVNLYQDGIKKSHDWADPSGLSLPTNFNRRDASNLSTDTHQVNQELRQDPRGAVSFDADGRAVIKFFSHADASTLPHELFHVFRREMMESIQDASATPAMKERYGIIEEFVGAKSGEAWTPEMEEKFATAAERYFLEGVAPSKELKGVFAKLKQWLTEIYTSLDLNKIPISDNMRKVFGEMLVPNFTESDLLFRKQMGEMLSYDSLMARASEYDRGNELNFDVDSNQIGAVEEGFASAEAELLRSIDTLAMTNPELAESAMELHAGIIAEADKELGQLDVRRQMEKDAIACELGR